MVGAWKTNRRTRNKFPTRGLNTRIGESEDIQALITKIEKGVKNASDFPHTIIFDWNGTIDARNTGVGIPIEALLALKKMGKNVIVYTSSTQADRKLFMRKILQANGIPYTDNEKILDYGDMFVADKKSDERRAGKHGVNFVYTSDFDFIKTIEKNGSARVQLATKHNPLPNGVVATMRSRMVEQHGQDQICDCAVKNVLGRQIQDCNCQVVHPEGAGKEI